MSFLLCLLPSSSFAASLSLVVLLWANLIIQVENKSFFGIGTRIIGDQLLVKDVLQTPPISLTEELVIKFKYAIVEPITYLEIESDKNVHANVDFSYDVDLVEGKISSINSRKNGEVIKPEPFEVVIQIYGFNETVLNINPDYILNKDQQFNGILKPIHLQKPNQNSNLTEDDTNTLDELYFDFDENDETIDDDDDDTEDEEDVDYDENYFDDNYDKIVEQGQRQEGDFLVYEINQTSATTSELPTNHSVTFYYVDVFYVTYVRFVIFEHYLYHPLNNYENTYVVEYAHISPTTLKAIVTDHRTTSLFVQMQIYGFHPTALPVDYKPFLSNSQTSATTRPISPLTQLKIFMNAQQTANEQQQKRENNTNEDVQDHTTELGHQIFPDNKSKNNCLQQVSPTSTNTGNHSQRISSQWSIHYNLILIILGTVMVFV